MFLKGSSSAVKNHYCISIGLVLELNNIFFSLEVLLEALQSQLSYLITFSQIYEYNDALEYGV